MNEVGYFLIIWNTVVCDGAACQYLNLLYPHCVLINNCACYNCRCTFRDVISQSEKDYCRGGGATGACVRELSKLVILDKECLYLTSLVADHALAQVVRHWPFTRQTQFRSKSSSCGFCGQSDAGTGFSLKTLLLPCHCQCHGCVSATQCYLAVRTVPAVMRLYNKAMTRLHPLRRGTLNCPHKTYREEDSGYALCHPSLFLFYLFIF
jgi:hypothetical protein